MKKSLLFKKKLIILSPLIQVLKFCYIFFNRIYIVNFSQKKEPVNLSKDLYIVLDSINIADLDEKKFCYQKTKLVG